MNWPYRGSWRRWWAWKPVTDGDRWYCFCRVWRREIITYAGYTHMEVDFVWDYRGGNKAPNVLTSAGYARLRPGLLAHERFIGGYYSGPIPK